jgi:antitoxin VapB
VNSGTPPQGGVFVAAVSLKTATELVYLTRSQAVRLPKEFRFEGKEVRIRRVGNGVLIEPMQFDAQTWLAEMVRLRCDPILPDGRNQPRMPRH